MAHEWYTEVPLIFLNVSAFLDPRLKLPSYLSDEEKTPLLKHLEQQVQENVVVKKIIEDERPEQLRNYKLKKCLLYLIGNACSKPSDLDATEKQKQR